MTPVPWFRHHGITSLAASRCSRLFSGCSESGYARGMLVGRLLPHGSGAHGSSGGDAIRLLPAVPVSPPWAGGTSLPALRRAVRYGDGRT